VPVDGSQPVAVALIGSRLIRVVWAADGGLGLYENADGDEPRLETFPAPAPIRALAFSPSGRVAIAGCADGTLLSLDAATGEFGRRVSIGLLPGGALAVASDEGPVVASLSDNSVRRFDLATGIAYVVATECTIRHVAITPDGNIVLALDAAGILYRWNVSLDKQPHLLELDADITALAVDSSGDKVLLGMPDGRLWLHDLTGGPAAEFGQPEPSFQYAAEPPPSPMAGATGPPPASEATGPQSRPDSGGVVDDDVGFTVYRPRFLPPEEWGTLLVFAHKTDPVVDPGRGPIDPVKVVEERAQVLFTGSPAPPVRVDARSGLFRGARLRIVPDLPGIVCNPPEAELDWWEPVHEVAFRLFAGATLNGSAVRGTVRIWCVPLLIGEVSLTINVRSAGAADDQSVAAQAPRYRKIFPSYSHLDHAIVEGFEDAARALGDQYLQDVLALRAGERWQPRLLELIQEADVFQLFWSSNSMRSLYCRQEWEHALALRRSAFVRPLYWEDPLPEDMTEGLPPTALRELHFVKVRSGRPVSTPLAPPERFTGQLREPESRPEPAEQDEIGGATVYPALPRSPTEPFPWPQPAADPALVVQLRGANHELRPGRSYRVGRDPKSDIAVADPRVSWRHGEFRAQGGVWFFEDSGSTNGTFAGLQRIDVYQITQECTLRLGNPDDGPAVNCSPSRPGSAPPSRPADRQPPTLAGTQPAIPSAAAAEPPPAATAARSPRPDELPRQAAAPGPAAPGPYAPQPTGAEMASAPRRPAVRRSLLITAALVILAIVAVLAIALH
jgi:hypothetical protein